MSEERFGELGRAAAWTLARRLQGQRLRLGVVTCLYDTHFESLSEQVRVRASQLDEALRPVASLDWKLIVVADDAEPEARQVELERGFEQARVAGVRGELKSLALPTKAGEDCKGAAIRLGLEHLSREGCDAAAYINLNLKVDLAQLPAVALPVLCGDAPVAIGTRAPVEGGMVLGAGAAGRLKSIAYNRLARLIQPRLGAIADTNAPLKVMGKAALEHLLRVSRVDDVCFDTEWIAAWREGDFPIAKVPILWSQRPGSRPPWHVVPRAIASLFAQRRRLRRGEFAGP